jgi:DNA-binding IclR family transcriptional regulator
MSTWLIALAGQPRRPASIAFALAVCFDEVCDQTYADLLAAISGAALLVAGTPDLESGAAKPGHLAPAAIRRPTERGARPPGGRRVWRWEVARVAVPAGDRPAEPAARGRRPARGEPVLDRAFALLDAFAVQHETMGLAELSRRAGMPKSTVLRLARKLVDLGVLERAADGEFAVGLRLWEIASLAPRSQGLRAVAMPYMEDLNLITRQHVLLAVRDGDEALLVERLSGRAASPVLYRIGGRAPLHSTGVGRVLLAFGTFELRQEYLGREWRLEPEGSRVSNPELRKALAEVRRNGYATVIRSQPVPMVSVAAPIWDGREDLAGALSVVVPVPGLDPLALVAAVRAAARAISRDNGSVRSTGGHGRLGV